jgi:hypothetical protein
MSESPLQGWTLEDNAINPVFRGEKKPRLFWTDIEKASEYRDKKNGIVREKATPPEKTEEPADESTE